MKWIPRTSSNARHFTHEFVEGGAVPGYDVWTGIGDDTGIAHHKHDGQDVSVVVTEPRPIIPIDDVIIVAGIKPTL